MSRATPSLGRSEPARPVISVGNLAMGGRGKTPVVALVARLLVAIGERPAILSRGYKRRQPEEGVVIVSDGVRLSADLDRSGDEPLMLAMETPGAAVLVSEIRATAAALAERAIGATVHVLDDAFQHRSVRKDIEIVLVAQQDLADRRVPFGRLRSPLTALRRADAVVLDWAADDADAAVRRYLRDATVPVFVLHRRLGEPRWIERPPSDWDARSPAFALAGIASPARFGAALVHAGYHVADGLTFPDHHRYTRRDVRHIHSRVVAAGATAVLTTEKDRVRMLPLRPLPFPLASVPLAVAIQPADAFETWLLSRLREARA